MDRAAYTRLRAFAATALGDRLPAKPDPAADLERAQALIARATLTGAEHAACELVAFAATLAPWPPAAEWPEPSAAERARMAPGLRDAARRLAAHLPEREAAELARAVEDSTPAQPAPAMPTAPSGPSGPETVEQRQARRLARLRALGGDRKRIAGKWTTTGHGALARLVAEEAGTGCAPVDEKGVRRDLTAAAERERAGKVEAQPFAALIR
jgi:hypothetical protein